MLTRHRYPGIGFEGVTEISGSQMSEREQLSTQLRNRLEALSQVDTSRELVRSDLGTASFEDGVPVLKMTVSLFKDLGSLDFLILPVEFLRRVSLRAEVTLNWLERVRNFNLNESNPTGMRDRLLHELETDYDQHMSQLGTYIGYLLVKQTDFNALDAAARDKMRELDEFTTDTRAEQDRIREEMDAALLSVRAAAAEAGVGQQSIVFEDQVMEDAATSRRWFWSVISVGGLSVLAAGWLLLAWAPSATTTGEIVGEIGGRFAVLTLLAFAFGFTVRQYTSSKHNQTLNRHRQNALRTFETFVSASDDKGTKDAVLLEATRAIFSPQSSGFLRSGREPDSPSTMVEVIRRIGTGPSSQA